MCDLNQILFAPNSGDLAPLQRLSVLQIRVVCEIQVQILMGAHSLPFIKCTYDVLKGMSCENSTQVHTLHVHFQRLTIVKTTGGCGWGLLQHWNSNEVENDDDCMHTDKLRNLSRTNILNNKKVLLRERKRHTAHRVASTSSAVLFCLLG